MTERERPALPMEESGQSTPAVRAPGLTELAEEAARLLGQTIRNTDPSGLDFKDVKQLTGALKDLAELLDGSGEREEGGIVIRIEGDPGG